MCVWVCVWFPFPLFWWLTRFHTPSYTYWSFAYLLWNSVLYSTLHLVVFVFCLLEFFVRFKVFKNIFIYFTWRLITSQYCIGFAIHEHESTMGVHVFPILNPLPPPSPYHPSGSSQCTSPKHPVSCIEPGLAIHFTYDIIHVSMPFSQIIPPSPSCTESKRLFYTSVSFLLSRI